MESEEIRKLADELDELLQSRNESLNRINNLIREIQKNQFEIELLEYSNAYN